MNKTYIASLITSVVVSILLLVGYFFISKPENSKSLLATDTTYAYISVNNPIQPIPEVDSINLQWFLLGKALFNTPLLSKDNSISCASCHLIDYGGDDGFPVSTGINSQTGTRNSPSVLNAVFNSSQFWDGRSHSLADQVSGPIHNPIEMNSNWDQIIEKLTKDEYFPQMFALVGYKEINQESIIKAITTFEEGLVTPKAPIDRYLMGEIDALNEMQRRGFIKFQQFGCISCHQGVNIGGNFFQKLGRIDSLPQDLADDLGRFEVTGLEQDKYVFKVPSLRNVAQTAPYFHNGSVKTLEEAVTIMARVQLGRELSKQDVKDLVALLQGFSAPYIESIN